MIKLQPKVDLVCLFLKKVTWNSFRLMNLEWINFQKRPKIWFKSYWTLKKTVEFLPDQLWDISGSKMLQIRKYKRMFYKMLSRTSKHKDILLNFRSLQWTWWFTAFCRKTKKKDCKKFGTKSIPMETVKFHTMKCSIPWLYYIMT